MIRTSTNRNVQFNFVRWLMVVLDFLVACAESFLG
jgi:hypothetical protein